MYRDSNAPSPLLVISFGGYVFAVERRTGTLVWRWAHEESSSARLLLPPGRVLLGYTHELVCLDYATGELSWRTKVPVATGTIVADGDEVFFGSAGEVGCVDVNTGTLLWHQPFRGMGQGAVALGVPGNVAQIDYSR